MRNKEDDCLKTGSYGGASDQTAAGPWTYGFNWWFNDTSRLNPDNLTWPDALPDTVMTVVHGGNRSALFPSLNLMVIRANGDDNVRDYNQPGYGAPLCV